MQAADKAVDKNTLQLNQAQNLKDAQTESDLDAITSAYKQDQLQSVVE